MADRKAGDLELISMGRGQNDSRELGVAAVTAAAKPIGPSGRKAPVAFNLKSLLRLTALQSWALERRGKPFVLI
jgi:hypothetical protein